MNKPIIGIMGAIGSGKSTVSNLLGEIGCAVIDADKMAHNLLEKPEIKKDVVNLFGEQILTEAGEIDRKKLGDIVFKDMQHLSLLNKIIHPAVIAEIERRIDLFQQKNGVKAIVLDIPLLVELGWDKRCQYMIFIECSLKNRLARLKIKNGINKKDLKKRENLQISLDKKAEISHYKVQNNSDICVLAKQLGDIFSVIISKE